MAATLKMPERSGAPSAPAKKAAPPPRPAANPAQQLAESEARIKRREEGLQGLAQLGAAACLMRGWMHDVGAIQMHSPAICHESAVLAETNAMFGQTLDFISIAGPYAALMTAALPLVLQIGVNHGRLNLAQVASFGVMDPQVLQAKAVRELQEELLRQQLAEQEAQREFVEKAARVAAGEQDAAAS